MTTSKRSYHDPYNLLSCFSNSEAYASELLENLEELFLRYYTHSEHNQIFDHIIVCFPWRYELR